MTITVEMQLASAAASSSCGEGALPSPPTASGSSVIRWCLPSIRTSCRSVPRIERAVAVRLMPPPPAPVLGDHPVEELADRGCRLRADEACHRLAVREDGDGRDALDAVAGGDLLLGVDVDLRELDLLRALRDLGLDRRAEGAARPAPGGPEVDDDGMLLGALDHVLLEGGGGDVHGGSFG